MGGEALFVSHLANIAYLTNFTGTSAVLLFTREALHFITDFRYLSAASALQASPAACPRTYSKHTNGTIRQATARRVVRSRSCVTACPQYKTMALPGPP